MNEDALGEAKGQIISYIVRENKNIIYKKQSVEKRKSPHYFALTSETSEAAFPRQRDGINYCAARSWPLSLLFHIQYYSWPCCFSPIGVDCDAW